MAIVLPTLVISGKASLPLGRSILIAAILADFLTLLGATLFAAFEVSGNGRGLLRIPVLFLAAIALLLYMRRVDRVAPRRLRRLEREDDPKELGIRAALAAMLVFAGLSEALGLEPILGAFLAGLVMTLGLRNQEPLRRKLSSFAYGFLIPVFFIEVGIGFRVAVLAERGIWVDVLWLLAAAVIVKVVPAFFYRTRGFSTREVLAMGALMSARLSLIIAVAELGVEIGILSRAVEEAVVVVALVTTTLAPIVFTRLVGDAPSGAGDAPDMYPIDPG